MGTLNAAYSHRHIVRRCQTPSKRQRTGSGESCRFVRRSLIVEGLEYYDYFRKWVFVTKSVSEFTKYTIGGALLLLMLPTCLIVSVDSGIGNLVVTLVIASWLPRFRISFAPMLSDYVACYFSIWKSKTFLFPGSVLRRILQKKILPKIKIFRCLFQRVFAAKKKVFHRRVLKDKNFSLVKRRLRRIGSKKILQVQLTQHLQKVTS